jgi:hypothetical protein
MLDLLYYTVSSLGLVCLLKYGSILARPRTFLSARSPVLAELFSCSLCLGFWAGIGVATFIYYFTPNWNNNFFLFPLFSAVTCWSGDSIIGIFSYLERYLADK